MTKILTTTDMIEYRSIPGKLSRLRGQKIYLKFIKDVLGAEAVEDRIIALQRRRAQLRRMGAY